MDLIGAFAIDVLTSASVSVFLTAALVFLFKGLIGERMKGAIQHEYNEKLETAKAQLRATTETEIESFKAKLKAEADVALEQLKSSLTIQAHERNVTVSGKLERRFEAISAIYSPLRTFIEAASFLVTPAQGPGSRPTPQERSDALVQAQEEFREAFHQHGIFLTQKLSDEITAIERKIVGTANVFSMMVDPTGVNNDHEHFKNWKQARDDIEVEVRNALRHLEEALRALMGDSEEAASKSH